MASVSHAWRTRVGVAWDLSKGAGAVARRVTALLRACSTTSVRNFFSLPSFATLFFPFFFFQARATRKTGSRSRSRALGPQNTATPGYEEPQGLTIAPRFSLSSGVEVQKEGFHMIAKKKKKEKEKQGD